MTRGIDHAVDYYAGYTPGIVLHTWKLGEEGSEGCA